MRKLQKERECIWKKREKSFPPALLILLEAPSIVAGHLGGHMGAAE